MNFWLYRFSRHPQYLGSIVRILLKKDRPENRRELLATFVIYAAALLLSLRFVLLNWPSVYSWPDWSSYTWFH